MVTITEKLHTDAAFAFTDAAGTGAGSWSTDTNAGWSGGTARKTSTVGDKVTITWSGRSLYLFTGLFSSNNLDISVTTDGVTRSNTIATTEGGTTLYRAPVVIERGLTDGPHTTVLQGVATGSYANLHINAVVIITGTRQTAGTGQYTACGDSWSVGTGAPVNASGGYVAKVRRQLAAVLQRDVASTVRGVGGAGLTTFSTQNIANGIQQITSAKADTPEFLSLGFGVNDIRTAAFGPATAPGLFGSLWRTTLCFTEDVFDVSSVKVCASTPGWLAPPIRYATRQTTGSLQAGFVGGLDTYELGVDAARQVFTEFPWLRVADIYAAMDRRTQLLYPNAAGDLGLHPNDAGHGVIAQEIIRAFNPVAS